MQDVNEIVTVELSLPDRLRVQNQIAGRMEAMGLLPYDWPSLDLGFAPKPGWPADQDAGLTLAQLIVVARRLGLRLQIREINLLAMVNEPQEPARQETTSNGAI